MHNNHINNLLDLKGVKVKNVISTAFRVEIYIETKKKPHKCPVCGSITTKIHDYRKQTIKDIPIQKKKKTYLILRKRRYLCSCGKRFYEKIDFLPKYHRMTNRLVESIIDELSDNSSVSSIATKLNISTHTVNRIFSHINYSIDFLPEVISIDEFKGNSGGSKYHCIIVDPKSRKVIDILKDRKFHILSSYFKQFKNRSDVKYIVIDMWRPYLDIAKNYFKMLMMFLILMVVQKGLIIKSKY